MFKFCNVTCTKLKSAHIAVWAVKHNSRHDLRFCGVIAAVMQNSMLLPVTFAHQGPCSRFLPHGMMQNTPVIARQDIIGSVVPNSLTSTPERFVQQSRCRCQTATTAYHPLQARSLDAPGLFGAHAHAAPHPPPLALSICCSLCPHLRRLSIVLYTRSHMSTHPDAAMHLHRLHPSLHHSCMTIIDSVWLQCRQLPDHDSLSLGWACMTCACLSMYAYLCTRRGKAWLPGNAAWDITCDVLLVYIAASNAETASVHISGNITQADLAATGSLQMPTSM